MCIPNAPPPLPICLRYGLASSAIMDTHHTGGGEMAVRLAMGETQVLQENREYFLSHGVDLSALESLTAGSGTVTRSGTTLPLASKSQPLKRLDDFRARKARPFFWEMVFASNSSPRGRNLRKRRVSVFIGYRDVLAWTLKDPSRAREDVLRGPLRSCRACCAF